MIHVTIDGKSIEVPERTTVLRAAQMAGINIPTLCDHPALKPYGSCRLCVVEVEGFRTLQASCTLPVSESMVVHTDTPKLRASRHFILSMLFSERNHFCMYCQKTDGDCELQNAAYGEGMDHWPIQPGWNPYPVDGSHPYYVFDHNRCILCRRCVRACGELVGNFTLGIENRGSNCIVIADSGLPLGESTCIKCGTCVQVCPTGALIDRESAYIAKDTASQKVKSICTGCSVGCGIELIVKENRVVHINGDFDAQLNTGVLCEVGRYQELDHKLSRITSPFVRKNGKLEPATWDEAITTIATHLRPLTGKSGSLAALASTRLPVEALYAFTDLFSKVLGADQVATIEEGQTTAAQSKAGVEPGFLNGSVESLKTSDCVVAVGVDLAKTHQVLASFFKRNFQAGTHLIVIDPFENEMDRYADTVLNLELGTDEDLLYGIASAIVKLGMNKSDPPKDVDLNQYTPETVCKKTGISSESLLAVSREIASAQSPVFVYGKGVTRDFTGGVLKALAVLARLVEAPALVSPKGKANSLAAHAFGLDAVFEPNGAQAIYLALGDDETTERLAKKINNAPFLAIQASYVSELTEKADVVLPVEAWYEQEGSYLNLEGRLQKTTRAVEPKAEVWSNVKVLEKLAECLDQPVGGDWEKAMFIHIPIVR